MKDPEGSLLRVLLPVIVGGLLVFGATSLYTDYWKKPDVNFDLLGDELMFFNSGQMPADNLRITIALDRNSNVTNFTIGSHSQNMTLGQEGDSWIMETKKFPVVANVFLQPFLKNASEPVGYTLPMASDQGVKEWHVYVDPAKINFQSEDIIYQFLDNLSRLMSPAFVAWIAAFGIGLLYTYYKLKEIKRLQICDKFLKGINDEVCKYYLGQKSEGDSSLHLKKLIDMRNKIRNDFDEGTIKRSDFETLENKILESIEKIRAAYNRG